MGEIRFGVEAQEERARGIGGIAGYLAAGEAEKILRLREGEDGNGHPETGIAREDPGCEWILRNTLRNTGCFSGDTWNLDSRIARL